MKILCVWGKYNYGKMERGTSYEYNNFLPALIHMGHDICFFESWDKSSYNDYLELNSNFLETVSNYKPDIIFCVLMGYEIWSETFELIRKKFNAVIINWGTDDSWKYEQFTRYIAKYIDYCVTTYTSALIKSKYDGYDNFILSQWAANSAYLNKPLEAKHCEYDVTFIGSAYGNRRKWIDLLINNKINVQCFGHGWGSGTIEYTELQNILRNSRISLNFADSGKMLKHFKFIHNRQIKARVFEVPGGGGLLFTEHAENIEEYYVPGKEIIIFESIEDLISKIRYYLADKAKRDNVAIAGYNRTVKEHTYENRFTKIFEQIHKDTIKGDEYEKSRALNVNTEFSKIKQNYKIKWFHKMFRLILCLPFIVIFGKIRGKRAARRFLFEVSWRISGKKTYSVKGLPGRLFYEQS